MWVKVPEVAVTVIVYVPASVPVEGGGPPPPPVDPPPQATIPAASTAKSSIENASLRRNLLLRDCDEGTNVTHSNSAMTE